MKAIVVVDRNWAIGRAGGLLFHLPGDLAFFKRQTLGKTIVMGRATLEALPGGKPLKGRRTIVLTRQRDYRVDGAEVVHSYRELADLIGEYPDDGVMLAGGGQIYRDLLDCCSAALVTKVDAETDADTFFPNLDSRENWRLRACAPERTEDGLSYRFCGYGNQKIRGLDEI